MRIRPAQPADSDAWFRLRDALWPDSSHDHRAEIAAYLAEPRDSCACYVAELPDDGVVGFVEVGGRGYAEGCLSSPVGYLEGIFVLAEYRFTGVGRRLVDEAEQWARDRGCTEMASDRELANEPSGAFHQALGYEEVERIVCFRKAL